MYSVLVADDNSNIQKMVSLALKDEGIDVVAVGNGEAAVRHLKDSLPDLILADIFMPARNGYEVCEFVKRDERLQHIPVILLVGAFDPLDDEEVRRVRADGVLKKPFVPPDPLIALVKSTLERVPRREPPPAAAPTPPEPPAAPLAELPVPEPEEPEEQPYRAPAFSMTEESPLAFGTLLESPPEPPAPPAARDDSELLGARGLPDDDVAAAQLESTGYFAMDTPSLAEPAAEMSPEPPSPLPGPFAESAWTPAPPAEEPLRAEEPAAPAEAAPPALEWPVAEEGSWPPPPAAEPPAHTPAVAKDEPELPGSIELLEPVMRSLPPAPVESAPPPAAEASAPPQPEPPREQRYAAPAQPDPAVVEAIVEKVVERLRPQLDEVARDILRPVAEAMLQRELDKVSDRSRN